MRKFAAFLCVICGLGVVPGASGDDTIYSSGGFERPAFEPGSIRGQDQWEEVKGRSASITTELVGEGIQALNLNSREGESFVRLEMHLADPHQASFLLRPYGKSGSSVAAELHIRGIDASGNTYIIQSFSLRGRRPVSNAEKLPESLSLDEDEWRRVLIQIDPIGGVFSLSIDDNLVIDSAPVKSGRHGARVYAYDFTVRGESEVDAGILIDNFEIRPRRSD